MLPDLVSNPGPLTYQSGALPTALRNPASLEAKFFPTINADPLPGLSHSFLGMGPGPLELGKIASF